MMNWDGGGSGWMMAISWIILLGLAVLLLFYSTRNSKPKVETESARQVLDRRFAEGQIGVEEYAQARRLLD